MLGAKHKGASFNGVTIVAISWPIIPIGICLRFGSQTAQTLNIFNIIGINVIGKHLYLIT